MNLYNEFNTVIKSLGMQTLTHPLFYNSNVAIRFNIGDNGNKIYLSENEEHCAVNPVVYFVCSGDKVLFHLYDDRGADLCAEKTDSIVHIYNDLNELILEYDREKIDSIFKAE